MCWFLSFNLNMGTHSDDSVCKSYEWILFIFSELPISRNTALGDLKNFLNEATFANLPYESHCGIGPIVLNDDECDPVDADRDEGANAIQLSGKKYVPLVSPYVSTKF